MAMPPNRAWVGSSPRGRGKHGVEVARRFGERLIPAWAGKTFTFGIGSQVIRAHPRVGGENELLGRAARVGGGSSPRGRGKRFGGASAREDGGGSSPRGRGKLTRCLA